MTIRSSIARALAFAVFAATLFALAAPASAGDPRATVYVVHGIPGVKVDVCVSGVGEMSSAVRYAERVRLRIDAGDHRLKVRRASKGECKGAVLAKSPLNLIPGDNLTAVARLDAGEPTVTRFDNDVAPTGAGQMRITAAHMLKGGAVDVWIDSSVAIAGLARGAHESVDRAADVFSIWGTRAGKDEPIVGPRVVTSAAGGNAYTFVMVGTTTANSRLVIFKQDVGTV